MPRTVGNLSNHTPSVRCDTARRARLVAWLDAVLALVAAFFVTFMHMSHLVGMYTSVARATYIERIDNTHGRLVSM